MKPGISSHVCILAPHAYPLLARDRQLQLIGGAELQMVLIARLLANRGWRVSMICLDYGQAEHVTIDGIHVIRAYKPDAGLPIIRFVWPRLVRMWKCMKQANADIYYQQTAGMLTGVMVKFCREYGKRSIYASASNPDLARNTSRIQYARDRWIYEYGVRNVDRIFVQNREQARLSLENFGRTAHVVPNCYELPEDYRSQADPKFVLWVSTIRAVKQPHVFLDLVSCLPEHQFVMVGGPDPLEIDLYESVRKRAESLQNLTFEGFVPFEDVEKFFDRALILVNTSESEGVPNAFLQAWARGVPTVSFVDAGARLKGDSIGRIVTQLSDMVSEVGRLLSSDQARVQEGLRSREYVRTTHSAGTVVAVYESHFRDLLRTSLVSR